MATNKFATMVHKNTNQITLILIYVALEWALIFMLLLDALLSYLILKFSQFFGLKAPCIFCSRIDHVFKPNKMNNSFFTDLLCETHIRGMGPVCSTEKCSRIDNHDENNIEQCDDKNLEKFIVFDCSEMKGAQYNPLLFQTRTCDFASHHWPLDSPSGEVYQTPVNKSEDDVSIGTEIPNIELTEEFHHQQACIEEEDQGTKQVEEDVVVLKTISIDAINHQKTLDLGLNDMNWEKVPNTSTSFESLHNLYKNLLLVEKKDSGTVESFDGTVTAEFKDGETMSIENLMLALTTKRKVLIDLYTELEEERSANAIATNQTMAMINRLQEEKAMTQMEALHYQRMMEEQSQYDQETLEYLNELITKLEKEKLELEIEVEVYKARVMKYEVKGSLNKVETKSESSSLSSSNFGDSDLLSIEDDGEDSFHENKEDQNTPIEAILCLDEFNKLEEDKLFTLHQVKHFEKKLFALEDNNQGEHFEVVEPMDHISRENGYHIVKQCGTGNGLHGKREEGKRINGLIAKRLFPLFQAIENEHVAQNGSPLDKMQQSVSESVEIKKINLDIEVE